jgi:hypothetical protein
MKLLSALSLAALTLFSGCDSQEKQLFNLFINYWEKTVQVTDSTQCNIHTLLVEDTEWNRIIKDDNSREKNLFYKNKIRTKKWTLQVINKENNVSFSAEYTVSDQGTYWYHSTTFGWLTLWYNRDEEWSRKFYWYNYQEFLSVLGLDEKDIVSFEILQNNELAYLLVIKTKEREELDAIPKK